MIVTPRSARVAAHCATSPGETRNASCKDRTPIGGAGCRTFRRARRGPADWSPRGTPPSEARALDAAGSRASLRRTRASRSSDARRSRCSQCCGSGAWGPSVAGVSGRRGRRIPSGEAPRSGVGTPAGRELRWRTDTSRTGPIRIPQMSHEAGAEQVDHLVDLLHRHGQRRHEPERRRARRVDEEPAVHRVARDLARVGVHELQRE
jgi:hypothetical protein